MSADPLPPPSPTETVKEITEKSASFIQWLAELIRRRNWFTLLLLVWVALILFCTPGGIAAQLLKSVFSFDIAEQFPQYPTYFWLVVGLIPIIALVIAVRSMPVQTVTEADTSERKAIKGLRPFTADDTEIFTKLQRNRSLRECLESITSENFRFGIFMGESGCGKTSFLQAGIVPNLSDPEANYRAVYVRFSDRLPINAIREDLSKQLHIPKENLNSTDLVMLLRMAVAAIDKPLILFFDQFEQFFVHAPRKPDRQPFIQALTNWYHSDLPVRVLVCMRGDMVDRLVELHQALGYALSPQEVFRLEKFSPEEATRVLQVIAETEKLRFEESFVKELTQRELADREDGTVSPVDLQILGWMIERQNADELRAFNQQAFQKFGGVEGLMTRFLEKTLEARVIKSQREAAVKVLLALTDLDRNVRAGALSLTEIQEKLKDTVKADEVAEAIRWLVRGDVRLITPEEKAEETVYELAHERLIPAVRKVAGKELTEVQKANELLDRRVNEWQGNQFSARYLFSPIELWRLKRQQPYLEWGANRRQKEQLWRKSWRRFYRIVGALALVLLLLLSGWSWLLTPTGQRWQMWRELATVSQKVNDQGRATAVAAFAKNKNFQQANKLFGLIQDESYKVDALKTIARIAGSLNNPQSVKVLNDTLSKVQQVQDESYKVETLISIASAVGNLDAPQAAEILNSVLATAQQFQSESPDERLLSSVAAAAGNLSNSQAVEVLSDILAIAQQSQNEYIKDDALSSIAAAAGNLDAPQAAEILNSVLATAQQFQDKSSSVDALVSIATAYGELNDPRAIEILDDILTTVQQVRDEASSYKVRLLLSIARAYGNLNNLQAVEVLNDALSVVQRDQQEYPSFKANALRSIAITAGNLNAPQAVEVLIESLAIVQQFSYETPKVEVLSSIASATGNLDAPQAAEILNSVLATAQQFQSESSKLEALSSVAAAAGNLDDLQTIEILNDTLSKVQQVQDEAGKGETLISIVKATGNLDTLKAIEILNDALVTAQQFQDEYSKAEVLGAIAAMYINLNNLRAVEILNDALATAQQIQHEIPKVKVMEAIAAVYSNLNNLRAVEVLNAALTTAQQFQDDYFKADALSLIAESYAKLDHWRQARQTVESCPSNGCRVESLAATLTVWAERQHPELAELVEAEEE